MGSRVSDGLAPLLRLVIYLEVHADLWVRNGEERPLITVGAGVEGFWFGPTAFLGTDAIGVLGIRLQIGGGGELGFIKQGAVIAFLGAESLGAFRAGNLEDFVGFGLGAPRNHYLGFILARLQDGAVDGRISGQRRGGGHDGGGTAHGKGGNEGGDEAR